MSFTARLRLPLKGEGWIAAGDPGGVRAALTPTGELRSPSSPFQGEERLRRGRGLSRKGGGEAGGELALHFFRLRAQHRLAEAAELAGERGLDFVGDLGVVARLRQRRQRRRGQAADDA